MLLVFGTARIAEQDAEQLRAAARTMVEASRAEDGCIEYAYSFDMFDPTLMRVVERWVDRQALAMHFATPHMAAWRSTLAGLDIRDVDLHTLEGESQELSV